MTTTLSNPATTPAPTRSKVASGSSFGGILKSEIRKLFTLRSIQWTFVIALAAGLGLSFLVMLSAGQYAGDADNEFLIPIALGASSTFAALVIGVLGVLAVTNEYSSGMILSSLVAVPKRGKLFFAKGCVLTLLTLIAVAVLIAGTVVFGIMFIPGISEHLTSSSTLTAVAGTALALVCVSLFAFGLGSLMRSSAGAISLVIGLLFVAPIIYNFLTLTSWEWVDPVFQHLPGMLLPTAAQGDIGTPANGAPAWGMSMLWMGIWTLAAVIPGALAFIRRDAK